MRKKEVLSKLRSGIIAFLTAFIILMLTVRLLISPLYAQIEYRLPGFPEDIYGFNLEERLRWAEPTITYLVSSEGIDYLASFAFEDGEPIYNALELSHMQDVKAVVTGMRIALAFFSLLFLALVISATKGGWKKVLLRGIGRGAWAIVGFIAAILFLLLLSFDDLFNWFHQIFFESGTWRFYTTDTLIRLFPIRFWRDAFIVVGGISLLFSGIVITFSHRQLNKLN